MLNTLEPAVGEVWDINCDPQVERERGGFRPALVISNVDFNRIPNGLIFAVLITGTDRDIRHHVRIGPSRRRIKKPSVLMCDQARSQSIERFVRFRGTVSQEILRMVQRNVAEIVDAYELYR